MFVNETKNDVEMNVRVAEKSFGKGWRIFTLVASIIVLFCGIFSLVLEIVSPSKDGMGIALPIVYICLGVVFLFFWLFIKRFLRFVIKKNVQGKEIFNKFVFNSNGYEISTTMSDGTTSATNDVYSAFTSVKEYEDMWLLSLNKANVFVVEKSGMVEGSAEDLSNFLKSEVGDKYKVCYKIK